MPRRTRIKLEPHYSPAFIAQLVNVHKRTIVRWIEAGKFGNFKKIGNSYRIPDSGLQAFWPKPKSTLSDVSRELN